MQREPEPEDVACMLCERMAEIETLADSCDRPDCPLNALFDRLPILPPESEPAPRLAPEAGTCVV